MNKHIQNKKQAHRKFSTQNKTWKQFSKISNAKNFLKNQQADHEFTNSNQITFIKSLGKYLKINIY